MYLNQAKRLFNITLYDLYVKKYNKESIANKKNVQLIVNFANVVIQKE
jgi:hypothetical protein